MTAHETVFQEFTDSEEAREYYEESNCERDEVPEEKLQPLMDDFCSGEIDVIEFKADVLQELLRMRLEEPYLNLDDVEWFFRNRLGEIQFEELENIVPEWRQDNSGFLFYIKSILRSQAETYTTLPGTH